MTSSTDISCNIPVAILRTTPYSLDWGASVYAKVIATNLYGDSLESEQGNGAIITTTPDSPTNLIEDYSQRTKSTLGLQWTAPVFIGGAVIEDYRINYRVFGGVYSVLVDGVTDTAYLVTDLNAGSTYEFTVEARNSYSFSAESEMLSLLCAFKPDPPLTITTVNENELVKIQWAYPVANGSPITAYKVYLIQSDGTTFTQESV